MRKLGSAEVTQQKEKHRMKRESYFAPEAIIIPMKLEERMANCGKGAKYLTMCLKCK
jgi:hypothetical protein